MTVKAPFLALVTVLTLTGKAPRVAAQLDTPSVRFTGLYSLCVKSTACSCADSSYYVQRHLIFRPNGRVYEIILDTNRDSAILARRYRRIVEGKDRLWSIGTYRVSKDTITAQINSVFFARGQRWRHVKTAYSGRLVFGSCILDWKAVPPYPSEFRRKLHRSLNGNFDSELKGRMYRFEDFPVVSILDEMK